MGLRINTNVPAIAAQKTLENTSIEQGKTLARLSSGQRIVNAGDDAAGLAVGSKLNAQIRGFTQAKRSTNDGISLIQTAEGSLNEISNILIRMRELGVQSASDTIGDEERGYLNIETNQLKQEIERISQSTQFNGKFLLNGRNSDGELHFQVGANSGPANRIVFNLNTIEATASTLGVDGIDVSQRDNATSSLETLDQAIGKLSASRASLGAMQNRLASTSNNLGNVIENFSAAKSRVLDTDYAKESSELVKNNIMSNAGIAVLGQASAMPNQALKLL